MQRALHRGSAPAVRSSFGSLPNVQHSLSPNPLRRSCLPSTSCFSVSALAFRAHKSGFKATGRRACTKIAATPPSPGPSDNNVTTYTRSDNGATDPEHNNSELPATNGAHAAPEAAPVQETQAEKPKENRFPQRWRVVMMMAVAFVLCNMDKVNMSVAVIPMAQELGWSATERGLVSSSFFWGYSLTQIPAGWLATKIGGAKVLMAGVALWSFGTLIAPPAAQMGIYALCATRALVGLGEGFAPSAATSVLASQVPARERSSAVATVWGGLDVGSAVGLLLSGPLIQQYGWPSVFYLFAFMGLVWCAFWPLVKPENQDAVMQNEPDKISTNGSSGPSSNSSSSSDKPPSSAVFSSKYTISKEIQGEVPWAEFFKCPAVWAVTVAHFCFNWGYYTLLAWLPSYFEMALGLNVEKSSILTLIPYVAMTMMMPLVGPVADGLVKKGWSLTSVRKLCQGMAFFGPAACMITCALLTPSAAQLAAGVVAPTPILVALLSVAFAMGAWSRGGLYCNHQDLSPKYASALLGITNTAGAIPGVLGVTSAGYLLDATNSWAYALFLPTAACQVFGLVVYSLMASSERQSWS